MWGNRESKAKIFLPVNSPLNVGKGKAKTFHTFSFSTECRKIGEPRRRFSLPLASALNIGKAMQA